MHSSAPSSENLLRLTGTAATLRSWLFDRALPLWWQIGADRIAGGFYEKLDPNGIPIEEPRRARVVARQLFAFSTAAGMGWDGPAREAIDHALSSLRKLHIDEAHRLIPLRSHDGRILSHDFDLYDYAFALFGLAAAASSGTTDAEETAASLLRTMLRWKHPVAGFEESIPRALPLKANPHMHMLEACLAWEQVSDQLHWQRRADEIARLALSHFIHPTSGALHEFFDGDWNKLNDPDIDIVEPGHQFEWAWLLLRWSRSRHHAGAAVAAHRLTAIAEENGVDQRRGLAIDGLNAHLEPVQMVSRLWPQTERIKAWALTAALAQKPDAQERALGRANEAAFGLLRYLDHPVPGSWWENINPDSRPQREPARASSLYHIICAIAELESALNLISSR